MLSVAEQYLRELNPGIQVELYGQEINPQSLVFANPTCL